MLKFSTSLTLAMGLALTAPMTAAMAQEAGAQQGADWLDIELNKSIVIETPRGPRPISITNPDIGIARFINKAGSRHGSSSSPVMIKVGTFRVFISSIRS